MHGYTGVYFFDLLQLLLNMKNTTTLISNLAYSPLWYVNGCLLCLVY